MSFPCRAFLAATMIASANLPADEPKDTQAMTLNLSDRQLSNVPEELLQNSLEEIWLDSNQIRELPDAIARLAALKRLSIYKNQLAIFPEILLQMVHLERINASQNNIDSLPGEIKNLINLQVLDLNYNELSSLPDELGELAELHPIILSF